MSRGGNAYTRAIPATVVRFSVLVPADGHSPLVLGSIVGADRKVCNFDCRTGICLLERLAYTTHDSADVGVALS
jgi:hypothetical protein